MINSKEASKVEWWIEDRNICRIQTNDPAIARQIQSWRFSTLAAWGVNCYLRIFRIPSTKIAEACKLLGIPGPTKNPGRVEAGRKTKNLKGQRVPVNVNQKPVENRKDASIGAPGESMKVRLGV